MSKVKECPDCLGTGVASAGLDDERRCPACGGRGFVPDDEDGEEEGVLRASRRAFLGMLAAAPLAAPAMLAAGPPEPSHRLVAGLSGVVGEAFSGPGYDAYAAYATLPLPNEALRELLRSPEPWGVPNRLFGAAVNGDGDAV